MSIKSTKTHTTTNIGLPELELLNKLATSHKMKNIQFINAAVLYFKKTGINPTEPELSPKDEIAKLEKRVNEVLKFFRVFEQDKLLPILERLIILEKKFGSSLDNLPLKDELRQQFDEIRKVLKNWVEDNNKSRLIYNQNIERLSKMQQEQLTLFEKNNKMLLAFFEAFKNRGLIGKLSEEDINRFYNACN